MGREGVEDGEGEERNDGFMFFYDCFLFESAWLRRGFY